LLVANVTTSIRPAKLVAATHLNPPQAIAASGLCADPRSTVFADRGLWHHSATTKICLLVQRESVKGAGEPRTIFLKN